MMSQHSHCAENYSLRSWMVSHPCGTHSTAMRGAVNIQGLQADPTPPGDIFPWRFHDGARGFLIVPELVNGYFYPHQWDVTLEVPHQVQRHCWQQNSNACWREQWENVFVHTSCLTCSLPSCLVTQNCSKKGFLSWSYSSLLSLLFLWGFPSFLARTSFLVSSYVLFWSSFLSSPSVISFNLCAAAVQSLNFPHFILHPISHFYGSLVLLPLSPPQLSSGSSRFLVIFFFLPTLCLSLKI